MHYSCIVTCENQYVQLSDSLLRIFVQISGQKQYLHINMLKYQHQHQICIMYKKSSVDLRYTAMKLKKDALWLTTQDSSKQIESFFLSST